MHVRFIEKNDYKNGYLDLEQLDQATVLTSKANKYSNDVRYKDTFEFEFNPLSQLDCDEQIEALLSNEQYQRDIRVIVVEDNQGRIVALSLLNFLKIVNDYEDTSLDRKICQVQQTLIKSSA